MSLQVKDVIAYMERLAPRSLAESWDNVGMMCGHPNDVVKGVWLALTPTMDVLKRAHAHGANIVITHHPLIFKAMKSLREDDSPAKELAYLIRHNMTLYSAHTNLDIAPGGVNDVLAQQLDLQNTHVLSVTNDLEQFNMSVYVPESHLVDVQEAVFSAGAGSQGAYSRCSWFVKGTGGFQPRKNANPYLGIAEMDERVEEIRLSFMVDTRNLENVVRALKSAHPYEEPVVDIVKNEVGGTSLGLGRIGDLPSVMPLEEVLQFIKHRLQTGALRYSGDLSKPIHKVAVLGGSGSGFIDAAKQKGADCYITGDLTYHHFQRGSELDLALIDAGHFSTEHPVLYALQQELQNTFNHGASFTVDEDEVNLFLKFN